MSQNYFPLKAYFFDQLPRTVSDDLIFYPSNLSLHILNTAIKKPGFYLLTISKYGFVAQSTLSDYLFTDKMAEDPVVMNFSMKDCEIYDQELFFNSLTREFSVRGKNILKTTYQTFDSQLQPRELTMFTQEIYADMYIADSSLADCNFYIPLLGAKPSEIIRVYVDTFNDTSIFFKGVLVPTKCQRGNLYLNLTLKRAVFGVDSQVKLVKLVSYEKIKVGTFNCNSSCLECRDDSSGCLACRLGEVRSGHSVSLRRQVLRQQVSCEQAPGFD